jgi:hypothetical protein
MTTNTATRIGTSNLVPPPQPFQPDANGDAKIPAPAPTHSAVRPPLPPTSSLVMPTSSLSASVSQLTSAPSGTITPHSTQSRRPPPPVSEHRACNCRNSKCLKLYCECFASGRYCNSCNCSNCMNNKEHEAARSKAIETILERNPNAFRPKIQYQQVCTVLPLHDFPICMLARTTLNTQRQSDSRSQNIWLQQPASEPISAACLQQ